MSTNELISWPHHITLIPEIPRDVPITVTPMCVGCIKKEETRVLKAHSCDLCFSRPSSLR